jgi:hypothetical protein
MNRPNPLYDRPDIAGSAPRRRTTTGDMISTLCSLGVTVFLADAALTSEGWRAAGLWLSAGCTLAGALRHVLDAAVRRMLG